MNNFSFHYLKNLFILFILFIFNLPIYPQAYDGNVDHSAHATDHEAMSNSMNALAMPMTDHRMGTSMYEGNSHGMVMNPNVMAMNTNSDILPDGCEMVTEEIDITISAGSNYASYNGNIFGFSDPEIKAPPCSKLNITFTNEDEVRHQFMIHGLPRYIYPSGMFHLEANGGYQVTGSLILPSGSETLLIHCDLSRHAELGMIAQLVIGNGSQDVPGIPYLSGQMFPDSYLSNSYIYPVFGSLIAILLLSLGRFVRTKKSS
jgi:FtsP/CotA-like multicopper oxidase with cupredoxin domain